MTPFVQDPDFTLFVGDSREVLRELPDGSVDCCVTSPPYYALRDYGTDGQIGLEKTLNEYVSSLVGVFQEVKRVLAPHGTLWLNLGDSYAGKRSYQVSDTKHQAHNFGNAGASTIPEGLKPKDLMGVPWRAAFALQDDGWYLRNDIIWSKPNPMPESVNDRATKAHEYVFFMTKNQYYFFDQEAVREPHTSTRWGGPIITQSETSKYTGAGLAAAGAADALSRPGRQWNAYPEGGRNMRSVWEIATQSYEEAHFATFPEELPKRCITAGCPEQVCVTCEKPKESVACGHNSYRPGVVLDPFMGAGTTALVARKLGRHSIGVELSQEYADLIASRLQQLSLFA